MSYLIKNYTNDIIKSMHQPLLIELSKKDIESFGNKGYEKSILVAKEIYNKNLEGKYKDSTNLLFIDGDISSTDGSIVLLEKLLEQTSEQIQSDKNIEIIKSIGKGVFSYFTGGVLKEYFGEYIDKGIDELNDLFSDIIDDTIEDSLEFLFDEGTGKLTDIVSDITKDKLNDIVDKDFFLSRNSIDKLSNLTAQFKENPTPLEIFSKVLQFILYTAIDSKKIIFINNPHKLDKDSISIISLLLSFGKDLKEKSIEQNEKKSFHTGISIVYCYSDKNFQPYSNIDKKYEEIKLLLDDQRRFAQRYAMLERPSSDIPNIAVKSSTFVGREEELKKLYYRFDISKKDKNFKNIEVISADPGIGKTKLLKKHLDQIQKFEKNGKKIIQLTLLNQVGHNSSNTGLSSLKESIVNEAKRLDSLKTFEETSVEKIKDFAKDQILNNIENLLNIDNIIEVGESIYEAGSFGKNSTSFIDKSKENINDKNQKTKEQELENIIDSILKLQELSDESFPIVLFIDDLQWIDKDSAEFVLKYFTNTYKINPYLVASLRASDANTSLGLAVENESFNNHKIELLKQVGIVSERTIEKLDNVTKLDINKINLEGLNEDNLFELISKTIQGNKEQSKLLSQNIIKQLNTKESKAVNTLFAIETINLLCDEKLYRTDEKEFSLNNKLILQNPLRYNQELNNFEQVLDETFQVLDKKYKTAFEHINSEQEFEQKFNLMAYAVFEERLHILKVYFKEYGNAAVNTLLLSSLLGAPFNSDIVKTIIEELSKTEEPLLQPLRKEFIKQSNHTLEGFHYDIIEEVYEILSRYVLFDNVYEYKHNLLEIFLEEQLAYTLSILFDKKSINEAKNKLYQIVLDKLYSNANKEGVYSSKGYNLEKVITNKSKYLFFSILMENRILKKGYILNKKLWAKEYIHCLNDITFLYTVNYDYEKCLNFGLKAVQISSYIYSVNENNDREYIYHSLYYKSLKTLADTYFKFQYYNECIDICNKNVEHLKKLPMNIIHKSIENPFKKIINLLMVSLIKTNRDEEIIEIEEKYRKHMIETELLEKMKKDEKFYYHEGRVSSLEIAKAIFDTFEEKESYILRIFNLFKKKYEEQGVAYVDMYLLVIEDLIKFYSQIKYDDLIIKYIKVKCDVFKDQSVLNEKVFINKYVVSLLELANYYKQKKDVQQTIKAYEKTLTVVNKFKIVLEKKTEYYSVIYNNLSGQYKILNDLKNALYYQEKAIEYIYILSENNFEWSKNYIIALDNLYRLYGENDKHNKSFEYFSRLIQTLEKLYSSSLKDQWLINLYIEKLHIMVSLFIENEKFDNALFYSELIYRIALENSYTESKIQEYVNNIFLIKRLIDVSSKYNSNN